MRRFSWGRTRALDDLLPPGGALAERNGRAARGACDSGRAQVEALLSEINAALRRRTRTRFPLPQDEAFEVQFVKNQPWGGYNYYLGRLSLAY